MPAPTAVITLPSMTGTVPTAPIGTVPIDTPPVEQPEIPSVPVPVIPDDGEDEGIINENEDSNEIVKSGDDEVPLDNTDLSKGVKHCILHFLELLLAAVMGGVYAGSTRKQKKEIAKLKGEDEER